MIYNTRIWYYALYFIILTGYMDETAIPLFLNVRFYGNIYK